MRSGRIFTLTLIIMAVGGLCLGQRLSPDHKEYNYFLENTPESSKAITIADLLKSYKLEFKDDTASLLGESYSYEEEKYPDGLRIILISSRSEQYGVGLRIEEYGGSVLEVKYYYLSWSSKNEKDKILYSNDSSWQSYNRKHQEFLDSYSEKYPFLPPLEVGIDCQRDFFKLMKKECCSRYGFFCGFVGVPPAGRIEIMRLISHGEFTAIRYVLFSDNLISRVYAAEALMMLKNSNIKLSDREKKKIKEMLNSDKRISICDGAAYDSGKIGEVLKEVEKEDLDNLLEKYGTQGYLD